MVFIIKKNIVGFKKKITINIKTMDNYLCNNLKINNGVSVKVS